MSVLAIPTGKENWNLNSMYILYNSHFGALTAIVALSQPGRTVIPLLDKVSGVVNVAYMLFFN